MAFRSFWGWVRGSSSCWMVGNDSQFIQLKTQRGRSRGWEILALFLVGYWDKAAGAFRAEGFWCPLQRLGKELRAEPPAWPGLLRVLLNPAVSKSQNSFQEDLAGLGRCWRLQGSRERCQGVGKPWLCSSPPTLLPQPHPRVPMGSWLPPTSLEPVMRRFWKSI